MKWTFIKTFQVEKENVKEESQSPNTLPIKQKLYETYKNDMS